MSTQAGPVLTPAAPVASVNPAPAKPITAIEMIEKEIVSFIKQREQAIANTNAIEGAIQGAQQILGKLKAEAAKAEALAKEVAERATSEIQSAFDSAKAGTERITSDVESVFESIKAEAKKI